MVDVEINCYIKEVEDLSRYHDFTDGTSVPAAKRAVFSLETFGAPPDGWGMPELLELAGRRARIVVEVPESHASKLRPPPFDIVWPEAPPLDDPPAEGSYRDRPSLL